MVISKLNPRFRNEVRYPKYVHTRISYSHSLRTAVVHILPANSWECWSLRLVQKSKKVECVKFWLRGSSGNAGTPTVLGGRRMRWWHPTLGPECLQSDAETALAPVKARPERKCHTRSDLLVLGCAQTTRNATYRRICGVVGAKVAGAAGPW